MSADPFCDAFWCARSRPVLRRSSIRSTKRGECLVGLHAPGPDPAQALRGHRPVDSRMIRGRSMPSTTYSARPMRSTRCATTASKSTRSRILSMSRRAADARRGRRAGRRRRRSRPGRGSCRCPGAPPGVQVEPGRDGVEVDPAQDQRREVDLVEHGVEDHGDRRVEDLLGAVAGAAPARSALAPQRCPHRPRPLEARSPPCLPRRAGPRAGARPAGRRVAAPATARRPRPRRWRRRGRHVRRRRCSVASRSPRRPAVDAGRPRARRPLSRR